MKLQFLYSAHRLIMVYFCTKFHENVLKFHENVFDGFKIIERTQFLFEKNLKGYNFATIVVTVLVFCTSCDRGLHLYQVS